MPGITGIAGKIEDNRTLEKMVGSLLHFEYKVEKFTDEEIQIAKIHLGYLNESEHFYLSQDNDLLICFFGEIFSYHNIEAESITNPAKLFAEEYKKNGVSFFANVNGSFNALIYHFELKKLVLVNDRFGTRPLYYVVSNNTVYFAPEVKAFPSELKSNIDFSSIYDLFSYGHLFGYKTMFKNINQLPEASYLVFQNGNPEIKRYWDYPFDELIYIRTNFSKKEIEGYTEKLQDTFLKSVERQTRKNRKDILISLSGGLDSRFVIAAAAKNEVDPLTVYTMGEQASEDVIYSGQVVKILGADQTIFKIQPENIWKDADYFSKISDSMSMIYGPIQGMTPLRHFNGKSQIKLTAQMCDAVFGNTLQRTRMQALMGKKVHDDESRNIITGIFNLLTEFQIKQVFTDEFYRKLENENIPGQYIEKYKLPMHSYFNLLMNEHGRRGTLGGNLIYNLMYETRMPSYDYDLMDLAYSLPIELRKNQFIYRRAFSGLFPELAEIPREGVGYPINISETKLKIKYLENKIIGRLKKTPASKFVNQFSRWNKPSYVSYAFWFRNELRTSLENFIKTEVPKYSEVFDVNGVNKIFEDHITQKADNTKLLWQTINLFYFLRNNF